ncbi:MAG: glycosyltransferase family 4 protein [Rhodospirillales bacterium]
MRIALDATPLTLSSGGLHRYVSELSRALAAEFPEDGYLLVSDRNFPMPPGPANLSRGNGARDLLEKRWWLWGLNRELARRRIDVFHGTNFEVPYLPLRPAVLTLHDLSPWLEPAWHSDADRVRLRTPYLIGLGLATLIVTPTEAVRRQAMERFRIPPQRIVVVPEAAAARLRPVETRPARPYFLYTGALEPRKNIPMLIDAWRAARAEAPVDLVLAGRRREDLPPLAPEPGLVIRGEVPEEELSALYSGALAFVYPSLYEGFGLPVLEAMQCGAAVITSRDPAISEVAGGAAIQIDARKPREWAEALKAAATRPEWISGLRAASLARARQFSWNRTARLTREVYMEAIRRS